MEKENIENLFEEEINTQNEVISSFADLPPVAPIDYEESVENKEELSVEEPTVEVAVEELVKEVEPIEVKNEQSTGVSLENINKEVLEHPNAKINLKTEEEEVIDKKELEELKNIKLSDNSSLKFVLILGLILLVVIFLVPFISEYI